MSEQTEKKSVERIEFIEVSYWTCEIDSHRHKTQTVANICLAKTSSQTKVNKRRWTREMIADAAEAVIGGKTYACVAKEFGISAGRMSQVISSALRRMLRPSNLTEQFPPHSYYEIKQVRAHSDFWMRQTMKFRQSE